jgi:hypothetical protein
VTLMNPLEQPVVPRNISNSEVTTFLSCKRQYVYNFVWELQPRETAKPLSRGTNFHYAMELYWRARLAGHNHETSMQMAQEAFVLPSEPTKIDILLETQFLWTRYMNFHNGFPEWRPLGTEVKHELPLTNGLTMAIRYDFYFEEIATGKCYILDYKGSYDFWRYEEHDLNAQMPKYIAVLQGNGYRVDGGILEEIRTRSLGAEKSKDAKNLWKRTYYRPSNAFKQSVLRQHISASFEIERFRALPRDQMQQAALPVLNKHGACKFCNYKDLCKSELEGKTDLSVDIRTGYTQNTYTQQYNERPPGL